MENENKNENEIKAQTTEMKEPSGHSQPVSADVALILSEACQDIVKHAKCMDEEIAYLCALEKFGRKSDSTQVNLESLQLQKDYFDSVRLSLENHLLPYCKSFAVGRWALAQRGVEVAMVEKLIRYIDITKAKSHEHLWSYAGFVPKNSRKNAYNGNLKEACMQIGKSFVNLSEEPDCFYGKLYQKELERRIVLNDSGAYSDLAKEEMGEDYVFSGEIQKFTIDRLRSQSQRYAIKIFLVHWYTVDYKDVYGRDYVTVNKNIVPLP
jgi:hypothetical protein